MYFFFSRHCKCGRQPHVSAQITEKVSARVLPATPQGEISAKRGQEGHHQSGGRSHQERTVSLYFENVVQSSSQIPRAEVSGTCGYPPPPCFLIELCPPPRSSSAVLESLLLLLDIRLQLLPLPPSNYGGALLLLPPPTSKPPPRHPHLLLLTTLDCPRPPQVDRAASNPNVEYLPVALGPP